MNRRAPAFIGVALAAVIAGVISLLVVAGVANTVISPTNCGTTASTGAGNAPQNASLFQAVKADSAGNPRLAVSMLTGSYLESGQRNDLVGGGAYGPFQIQHPLDAPAPGPPVHPDITVAQARNPAYATNYMLKPYEAGLNTVNPGDWYSNPERAAEEVVFAAEQPGTDYYALQGAAKVKLSFQTAVGELKQLGIPTNFGSNGSSTGNNGGTVPVANVPGTTKVATPSTKVYMVGDSITVRAKKTLEGALEGKGLDPYIDGSVSRSITGPGQDPKTSGLQAVEQDKSHITKAGSVVIALGTNQNPDFAGSIKSIVKKVKSYNGNANIYWVNVFSKGSVDATSINKTIASLATSQGYTVIDTIGKVDTDKSGPMPGVHETMDKGTLQLANLVAKGVTTQSTPATANACSGGSTVPTKPGKYQRPLRAVKNLQRHRIDQGVDYAGNGPVYAMGNGRVTLVYAGSGWPGGHYIVYQLSDGPAQGKYVYFAEDCQPTVTEGQKVSANTVICNMYEGSDGVETGWSQPRGTDDLALAKDQYAYDGLATAYGQNFSQLLQALGDPTGVQESSSIGGSLPANWPSWTNAPSGPVRGPR